MGKYYKNIFSNFILATVYLTFCIESTAQTTPSKKSDNAKIYSRGIHDEKSAIYFFELKVIEVDPITFIAKEAVPFDRPFFLKIKRYNKGKEAEAIGVHTELETLKIDLDTLKTKTILEKTKTITDELKKSIKDPKTIKKPSTIDTITLEDKNPKGSSNKSSSEGPLIVPISKGIYPKGDVYQEEEGSEFIFIKIGALKPGHGYNLSIVWNYENKKESTNYKFTTIPGTLDKRLNHEIHSQFGVIYPLFKNDGRSKPVLMLGAYFHPRPIDPDISMRNYKLFAPQRFSLLFGVTINSIAEKNRRDDIIGNSNLLGGLGYQPTNALRFTYGALIFQEINPNPLFRDRTRVAATSYIGATLDIKLKDILSGVFTTLGFK